ncbi:hypothetical protein L596_012921 [Steinernema carpocapsae]|uniref:Uncharacterized protein n=1 Tax=Steinernema carpocapsae TaxID=34508 RepID=A0A4U5NZ48_STECR|nr:hypothetical protein L596_012921 [Steinernema carpocapsae]
MANLVSSSILFMEPILSINRLSHCQTLNCQRHIRTNAIGVLVNHQKRLPISSSSVVPFVKDPLLKICKRHFEYRG